MHLKDALSTAGEIWLNDTNLATLSGERLRKARLPLAMIWQHASLVRRRSVLSNVAAGALGRYGEALEASQANAKITPKIAISQVHTIKRPCVVASNAG